ncbi:hypothetical protein KFE98_17635 [bacterium SCSIO 12741]|nr:hypothetical protein KFE98_17635 [bacterium SCSIO 12741]
MNQKSREDSYRGYGVIVGVNEVDEHHYADPYNLDKAICNSKAYLDFAKQSDRFEQLDYFCGSQATWANVKALLLKYAELSYEQEGFLFISFTGHGENLNRYDDQGCFKDNWQLLCYYDQMASEEEIRRILSVFHKNFTVVFVSDACFSGGLLTQKSIVLEREKLQQQERSQQGSIGTEVAAFTDPRKSWNPENCKEQLAYLKAKLEQAQRRETENEDELKKCKEYKAEIDQLKSYLEAQKRSTYFKNKGFYDKMLDSYQKDPDFDFEASVCFMGSGREFGASKMGKDDCLLHYSALLLAMLNSGTFKGNYFELNDILTQKMDRKYKPYFWASHDKKKDRFRRFRPFVLYGRAVNTPLTNRIRWKMEVKSDKNCNVNLEYQPKWLKYQESGMRRLSKVKKEDNPMIQRFLHRRGVHKGYVLVIGMRFADGSHDFCYSRKECSYLQCSSSTVDYDKCVPKEPIRLPELKLDSANCQPTGKPNAHIILYDSDYHRVLAYKEIPFKVRKT